MEPSSMSERPKITPRRLIARVQTFMSNVNPIEEARTPIPKPRPKSIFSARIDSPPVPKPRSSLLKLKRKNSSSSEDNEEFFDVVESNIITIETNLAEQEQIGNDYFPLHNSLPLFTTYSGNRASLGLFPGTENYTHYSSGVLSQSNRKSGKESFIHVNERPKSKKIKLDRDSQFFPNCSIL